jgi:hypothetical protein
MTTSERLVENSRPETAESRAIRSPKPAVSEIEKKIVEIKMQIKKEILLAKTHIRYRGDGMIFVIIPFNIR